MDLGICFLSETEPYQSLVRCCCRMAGEAGALVSRDQPSPERKLYEPATHWQSIEYGPTGAVNFAGAGTYTTNYSWSQRAPGSHRA